MKSEFALAFNQICAEYNLPREVVLDAIRAALVTAYRRDWKIAVTQNVTADISLETGLAHIFLEKVVVEQVEDPDTQVALKSITKQKPAAQLDELLMIDVTPHNFGRIAAQTAKQVITQRLREAERESQFNRFSRQENEIIIGTIQSINPQSVTLHLERTEEAHMPRREQIPGERYALHQKIRVYVLEVRRTPRGPEIIVSRSHPLMLRRLLELEVPEIRGGQVEIKAIAREAGTRAKVAVAARQPGLDAVGACVGMRGIRIQTISHELHGERIDVIAWDKEDVVFIGNALSMSKVLSVVLDPYNPGGRTASVTVMDDQLSLAIGRSGQNARLAAKLTNWRIDIQGASEAALWALEQVNATPELLDDLKTSASFIPRLAAIMHTHEDEKYPYTDEEIKVIKTTVEAVRHALVARRDMDRPATRQARARRSAQAQVEAERLEARREAQARVPKGAYEQALQSLELSDKVLSNLLRNGINNVGDIMERLALGDEALLALDGVGVKALRHIKDVLEESGLTLAAAEIEVEATDEAVAESAEVVEAVVGLEVDSVAESAELLVETEVPGEVFVEPEEVHAEPVEEAALAAETAEEVLVGSESVAEEAPEGSPFAVDLVEVPEVFEAFEEEEDFEDDRQPAGKKRRKHRKDRTVVFDDKTGETFVMRKHRRRQQSDVWDEYGGDY
ncbi:MAG: transcription termination/antitermination protein NusA [Anaerolineae bacterium]|nr:transcription termination/antitermination protein NusA [Anaerolineae bacterium]